MPFDDSRVSHQPKTIKSHLDEGSYSYKPVRSSSKQGNGRPWSGTRPKSRGEMSDKGIVQSTFSPKQIQPYRP